MKPKATPRHLVRAVDRQMRQRQMKFSNLKIRLQMKPVEAMTPPTIIQLLKIIIKQKMKIIYPMKHQIPKILHSLMTHNPLILQKMETILVKAPHLIISTSVQTKTWIHALAKNLNP